MPSIRSLKDLAHRTAEWLTLSARSKNTHGILDRYVQRAPDAQRTLDIFKSEWLSALPVPYSGLRAGVVPLFGDPRIIWANERLGFRDKTVLELGPHEGGHSWMMANMGAASITAVEWDTRAFLKCLIIKELLNTERTRFLCGDFVSYMDQLKPRCDIVLASGVLYHMRNPVHVIDLISRATDRAYFWTHYYDGEICGPPGSPIFPVATAAEHQGFRHTLYRFENPHLLQRKGGGAPTCSHWLTRGDILGALRHFGFQRIETAFEVPDHGYGPAFSLVAVRS